MIKVRSIMIYNIYSIGSVDNDWKLCVCQNRKLAKFRENHETKLNFLFNDISIKTENRDDYERGLSYCS